jgi:hypothetical protein
MRWKGHLAYMGKKRGEYEVLVWKPKRKKRPRRRWEDNIKIDLHEVRWSVMDWIDLLQDRDSWRALVNSIMSLRVPSNTGNFLTSGGLVSFSRRRSAPWSHFYNLKMWKRVA